KRDEPRDAGSVLEVEWPGRERRAIGMYPKQSVGVPRDEFLFAQPELGQPGERVMARRHSGLGRAGGRVHWFGMPRANGPGLSEKQYVRTTIDASQFPFDRRERIERGMANSKPANSCRRAANVANDGPCNNTKTSCASTICAKRCSRSRVRGRYS